MAARGVDAPSASLAPSVPRSKKIEVDPAFIGKIIGKGGETIKALIENHSLSNIDVAKSGVVTLSGLDDAGIADAVREITQLCVDDDKGGGRRGGRGGGRPAYEGPMPEADKTYRGTVASVSSSYRDSNRSRSTTNG